MDNASLPCEVVYICHKYSDDVSVNVMAISKICEDLKHDYVMVAPQLYLGIYISDIKERRLAMQHCLRLLSVCSKLIICSETISLGMQEEIQLAHELGIPVVYLRDVYESKKHSGKVSDQLGEGGGVPQCVHKEYEARPGADPGNH